MDRLSRAEVGGPYASHDDAMRAIQNKGFDADPADLTVQEGSSDKEEGSSKESSLKHAGFPPPADSGAGVKVKPQPKDPLADKDTQDIPESAPPAEVPETVPDDTADPTAPDNGSSLPGVPQDAQETEDPFGTPSPQVVTTKPAQMPSGGGGGMPGTPGTPDQDGDTVGSEEDVQVPPPNLASGQFDDEAPAETMETPDPIGKAVTSVTAQVMRDNPDLPEDLARRVARKVVGKMLQANALMPHIEDPLRDKMPHELVKPIIKSLPKGSPAAAPSHEDDARDPAALIGDHPDDEDEDDDSSLPMAPGFQRGGDGNLLAASPRAGAGAASEAAGVGAATEGAGLAELAPLLLL